MKKHLFVLGMVSAFALCGCHGTKKVDFAKFQEEVKALEEVKVTEVKITGKLDDDKINVKFDTSKSVVELALDSSYSTNEKLAYGLALSAKTPGLVALAEDEDSTYYVGMGFKVVANDKSGKIEWDSKGLLASYQAKDEDHNYKLNFTWKKA